ncbi:uncharacterized protein LAESUDRAFT_717000 [Laetiporus sulphureus 93-53]|uniref:Peptidase C14 caspase domain-containing protein n=1 Tax=Laetiporus sulphureus 93-53 TaxID=1314785 RepID=A0A165C5L9_9APHY|nr:uncharacterized protein LAESUDRAFT_717000 [Laetiporus sulphureus 93-53]KZT02247.1 hypothetical protein LAESUDRAFT_717000 [Laetiporus sulphureus 93-53]
MENTHQHETAVAARTFVLHEPDGHDRVRPAYAGDFWREWSSVYRDRRVRLSVDQKRLFERLFRVHREINQLSPIAERVRVEINMSRPVDPVEMRRIYAIRCQETGSSENAKRLKQLFRLHDLNKEMNDLLWSLEGSLFVPLDSPVQTINVAIVRSLPAQIPRLWAVIIGINNYRHERQLKGAVSDAHSVQSYLRRTLNVPREQIAMLIDEDATRERILGTLYDHLRDNRRIKRGDAILIHFSGHGATYNTPAGPMEAITPVDRYERTDSGCVLDISDRELGLFLGELCREKGKNITVVLDCCFSGGATRSASTSEGMSMRAINPLPIPYLDLLCAAENNPRKRWARGSTSDGRYKHDPSTHVLLAACQDYEQAQDLPQGGAFTIALIRQLCSISLSTTTYTQLIMGITGLRRQQPLVAGRHRDSIIFRIGHDAAAGIRALLA